jgi:hypothetical protein
VHVVNIYGGREMKKDNQPKRTGTVIMELSTFHIPPQGDALVLGRKCPIGSKAAKNMLDTVAPGQFEMIELDDDVIESVFVKSYLFLRTDRDKLVAAIVEEAKRIMGLQCMISVKCDVTVKVTKEI